MNEKSYKISMSLNVLNHLGINLYSNIPAVLSEVVANSWDADAQNVNIEVHRDPQQIIIDDDGVGMTYEEINEKYLNVGYPRRLYNQTETPVFQRPVMGRKGIGKLSLFSIAEELEVHTKKNEDLNSFKINVDEMRRYIESEEETYYPVPLSETDKSEEGTKIKITRLKKKLRGTEAYLKKRLARRFSIIGDRYHFNIFVNNEKVLLADRDYFHKIQYLWTYGDKAEEYKDLCTNLVESESRPAYIDTEHDYSITGWLGTVQHSGDLYDEGESLNRIVIMVRGKVAQEDILQDFSEGGIYTKYIFGEINADFLDRDDLDDITTTSRQRIIENDERYLSLKHFVQNELKHIQSKWTDLRNREGTKVALQLETIQEWYSQLDSNLKSTAQKLFGKINQLPIEPETEKFTLMKHGILAFENLRYKEQLDKLENIDPSNIREITNVFAEFDDIEASLYHQIASERVHIIRTLQEKVEENALEKVIQEHIYKHLWLLDPSWERATRFTYLEDQVHKHFDEVMRSELTSEERNSFIDIRYVTVHDKHVIIELKKADRTVKATDIADQLGKYQSALEKCLHLHRYTNPIIECVCILGRPPSEWNRAGGQKRYMDMLHSLGIHILYYNTLLENAYRQYERYLQANKISGRITDLVERLEQEITEVQQSTTEEAV